MADRRETQDVQPVLLTTYQSPRREPARASRNGRVGGIGADGSRFGDHFFEERRARKVEQAEIERLRQAGEMKVPFEDLAELKATVVVAPALDQAAEMAAHEVDALFKRRRSAGITRAAPGIELAKDIGIGQRPAADRDGGAAGFLERGGGVGDRSDVAIGDDRYPIDGLHHGADARAIHRTLEALLTCAAMDDHAGNSSLLEFTSEGWRRQRFVVPAEPHLHGDGNRNRIDNTLHQLNRTVHLAHERRATACLDDFAYGATHVDIDCRRALLLHPAGGLLHLGYDMPVKLDRQRPVAFASLGKLEGPAVFFEQATVRSPGRWWPGRGRRTLAPQGDKQGLCSRRAEPERTATGSAPGRVRVVASQWMEPQVVRIRFVVTT